jgi:hypothetical protein
LQGGTNTQQNMQDKPLQMFKPQHLPHKASTNHHLTLLSSLAQITWWGHHILSNAFMSLPSSYACFLTNFRMCCYSSLPWSIKP